MSSACRRKAKKRRPKKEPKKSAKRAKTSGASSDLCRLWAKHQTEDGAEKCRFGRDCRFRHAWADKRERKRFEKGD